MPHDSSVFIHLYCGFIFTVMEFNTNAGEHITFVYHAKLLNLLTVILLHSS